MIIHKNTLPPISQKRANEVCIVGYHRNYREWLSCLLRIEDYEGGGKIAAEIKEQIEEELFPFIFAEKDNNA